MEVTDVSNPNDILTLTTELAERTRTPILIHRYKVRSIGVAHKVHLIKSEIDDIQPQLRQITPPDINTLQEVWISVSRTVGLIGPKGEVIFISTFHPLDDVQELSIDQIRWVLEEIGYTNLSNNRIARLPIGPDAEIDLSQIGQSQGHLSPFVSSYPDFRFYNFILFPPIYSDNYHSQRIVTFFEFAVDNQTGIFIPEHYFISFIKAFCLMTRTLEPTFIIRREIEAVFGKPQQ